MNADDFRRMLLDEIRNLSAILGVLTSEVTKLRRAQEPVEVSVDVLTPEKRYEVDSKFRSMVDTMLVALEEKPE